MRTLVAVTLVVVTAGAAAAQERPPVIDMHMHAHKPGEDMVPAGAPSLCRPTPCRGEGRASATPEESLARTLEAMDRNNVVKAFLSGEPDVVRAWVAAAPDRFIPSPFILHPGTPSVEHLREEYRAGRLAGMGEVAVQLTGVAPDDPVMAPYFDLAAEMDIPILVHTLGIGPHVPGFRSAAGNPLLLEPVLAEHRELRIWIENSGYPFLDETIAMMYQYPQLHGDLSTISWVIPRPEFYRYLEGLVRAGLTDRLLFGSDQMRWPETLDRAIRAIEEAPFLTQAQKRAILYENAARILRLGDEVTR